MRKIMVIAVGFIFLAAAFVFADEPYGKLDFDTALKHSLEKNEEVLKAVSDIKIAEAVVEKTYSQFDLFFTGGATYLESKTDPTSPLSPEKTDVFSYNAGLSNKLFTGGILSLELEYSKTGLTYPVLDLGIPIDTSFFTSSENPIFTPKLTLTYVQPILKNFWGRPDEKAIKVGDLSVKLAKEGLRNTIIEDVAKLKEAYFLIYMADMMYKVQQDFYKDAERFYKQSVDLKKIGLREEKDVLQTKASVLNSKAELTPAENTLKVAKENFLNMAGYPGESWDSVDVAVSSSDLEEPHYPDEMTNDLESTLIDVQPAVVMAKLGMEMQKTGKEIAENNSLPELNLIGSYGVEGTGADASSGYEEMATNNYNNFMIAAELKYSFPNRGGSGDVKENTEKLTKAEKDYEAARKGMKIMVRDAYRRLLSAKENYEMKKEAKSLQKKRLAIEEKNFGQGRISTQQLLMAQTDYHTSRIKEITAFYDYVKAVNSWNKVTGKYDSYYNEYTNKGEN